MAVRRCPQCLQIVPAPVVVAYSDDMECPGCKAQLEVSGASRMIATWAGLLAAAIVWRLTRGASGMLDFVLPVVYAFLAFSVVTPLLLMTTADLRLKSVAPAREPVATGSARGPGNH